VASVKKKIAAPALEASLESMLGSLWDDTAASPPTPPKAPDKPQELTAHGEGNGTGHGEGYVQPAPNLIFGTNNADSIDGTGGDDIIDGRDGGDVITGGAGDDILKGGKGATFDFLNGGEGDDTIFGAGGKDTILGGGGNDTIYTDTGATVDGGDGNDEISGSGMIATGGAGADRFDISSYLAGTQTVITDFAGGEDTIYIYNPFVSAITWTAHQDGANAVIETGQTSIVLENVDASLLFSGPNDSIGLKPQGLVIIGTDGTDFASGTRYDDVFESHGGNDFFWAGEGIDTVRIDGAKENFKYERWTLDNYYVTGVSQTGGTNIILYGVENVEFSNGDIVTLDTAPSIAGTAGNDELFAAAEGSTINAGAGDDLVIGGDASDVIMGGDGIDVIHGLGGPDVIYGGAGGDQIEATNSKIYGGSGDDTIFDFGGTVTGGTGADVFRFQSPGNLYNTTITDFASGEDKLQFENYTGNPTLWTVSQAGSDTVVAFEGNTIVLKNFIASTLSGGDIVVS
jgi:Ca2+-binding RTX toxin-like protein